MRKLFFSLLIGMTAICGGSAYAQQKAPIDYVNPYIGNISHLLVPTFPTVQLPYSMLRVYPERADYTSEYINGLPIIVTNHRERSAFKLIASQSKGMVKSVNYDYDNEKITPYDFNIDFDNNRISAHYAVSHQSAIYDIRFKGNDKPAYIELVSKDGNVSVGENWISGKQKVTDNTNVYVYIETQEKPEACGILDNGLNTVKKSDTGSNVCAVLKFRNDIGNVHVRYGISFISEEQAKANLYREQKGYDADALASEGRKIWSNTLDRITVTGGTEREKTVFYTSFYRQFERPVCMSEDGRYFSAFDGKVHEDNGVPFYTDDWVWDTYRAAHPLRLLLYPQKEENVIASYLRMAEQMGTLWMPTFPEITGDSRRMNSNHGVAMVADAVAKGLNIDAKKAFEYCRKGIEEKTLAPWSSGKSGYIDNFYEKNGYIPAVAIGEKENDPNVHPFEKRQPIAVTLGTAYDEWCLSRIASFISSKTKKDKTYKALAAKYEQKALNYRNVYNPETAFFHPKDSAGRFIQPLDYSFCGGMGAREYYGENNAWVYRWDVPHNVADLISMMGGNEKFIENLDQTFSAPLGKSKFEFYAMLPDHTGNIGQFSMANEPSLHIPYLYNYAGAPWKTQKRVRQMLKTWFRDDLMGVPGDEDGSGMTAFVVFSSMGMYPVTPGFPAYNIASPLFTDVKIKLDNGKIFEIVAENADEYNKYIQSATLNGVELNKPWISHDDVINGGKLVLKMGKDPNMSWGAAPENVPPSMSGYTK